MSSILSTVDQRTNLVGENRLELLMFRLGTRHAFAINVFQVKEVIGVPKMNTMPGSHGNLCGVTLYRGNSIPVIDLRSAIRMKNSGDTNYANNVIITEYNRSVQGFLIGDVLSIVNTSWQNIQPPPLTIGKSNYLTAISQIEIDGKNELVEIIDVTFPEGGTYNGLKTLEDATGTIGMFTRGDATFSSSNVPTEEFTIIAIVSQFNDPQVVIRNLNDIIE